ncbi:50S ribosomal protein L25 [Candidatus Arthromitus sp. SFB-rat-Yit]|uniref:50S ribosomal protein L25 n=1 Tax=Candidatus Arthromitus sp. SFB-rat-Yit TaxID=1041504 RepID=UPI000227A181|nr:50S ribosomal protein L25 [Candidatus Arthromitus sp. SFB-rat-Yit]BAK81345.1 50S ribosomal protein L25/general stress protein Ctc [Candidatus Arthromitus sp. SFB-rat-Yit]
MINAMINNGTTKGSTKRLRKEGKVVGNIYGTDIPSTKIVLNKRDVEELIAHGCEHNTVEVNVEGKKYNAIIKEIQKCHITNNILHVDFECFNGDKVINAEIPVNYINEFVATKNGAFIQKEKSSIKVRCKASKIPDKIDLVIKEQMLGHAVRISDMEIGDEITILDSLESVVASINFAKNVVDDSSEVIPPTESGIN